MTADFPMMQSDLVSAIPTFLGHIDAHLVSFDISPTGLVNAIFHDNRSVCTQATGYKLKVASYKLHVTSDK